MVDVSEITLGQLAFEIWCHAFDDGARTVGTTFEEVAKMEGVRPLVEWGRLPEHLLAGRYNTQWDEQSEFAQDCWERVAEVLREVITCDAE